MKGQYNSVNLCVGKRVELRRGYNTNDKIWGIIEDVKVFDNVDELLGEIQYNLIIPDADAKKNVKELLTDFADIDNKLIAFKIKEE